MTEESLGIVRGIYCRSLRLDPDLLAGLAEFATSDTEFDFTDAYPDGPVVRGVDGVRRIAANWPWDALHFDPERFFDVAKRALVGGPTLHRNPAPDPRSGGAYEHQHTLLTNGRLARFKVYSDREQALEAAGMRE
jgi:hypothetical protein